MLERLTRLFRRRPPEAPRRLFPEAPQKTWPEEQASFADPIGEENGWIYYRNQVYARNAALVGAVYHIELADNVRTFPDSISSYGHTMIRTVDRETNTLIRIEARLPGRYEYQAFLLQSGGWVEIHTNAIIDGPTRLRRVADFNDLMIVRERESLGLPALPPFS